jgi:hypothetical protein
MAIHSETLLLPGRDASFPLLKDGGYTAGSVNSSTSPSTDGNKLRVQRAGIALGEFRKDVLHELFIF